MYVVCNSMILSFETLALVSVQMSIKGPSCVHFTPNMPFREPSYHVSLWQECSIFFRCSVKYSQKKLSITGPSCAHYVSELLPLLQPPSTEFEITVVVKNHVVLSKSSPFCSLGRECQSLTVPQKESVIKWMSWPILWPMGFNRDECSSRPRVEDVTTGEETLERSSHLYCNFSIYHPRY